LKWEIPVKYTLALTPDVWMSILPSMNGPNSRYSPGQVRDALLQVMALTSKPLSVKEIEARVQKIAGPTPPSSIRSYLRLNTPDIFVREERGIYRLRGNRIAGVKREIAQVHRWKKPFTYGHSILVNADCFDWIENQDSNSIHAVITDPPYGLRYCQMLWTGA
jgi:site-specific DNA-methyltransferase (adenine-specific)